MSSVTPQHRSSRSDLPKNALKSIDREVQTLKNRIRKLEIQQAKTNGQEKMANNKAAQLFTRKMIIEQLAPLKHRDLSVEQVELELRKKEIHQSRAERQQEVRDVKQALYLMKREQAKQLHKKKQELKEQIVNDKKQFISQRQERHDKIKAGTTHDRYLSFMQQKLTRARIEEKLNKKNRQDEIYNKLDNMKTLEQREKMLLDKLKDSQKRSLEADRRYAMVYELPGEKLASQMFRDHNITYDYCTLQEASPTRKQSSIHESSSSDRRKKLFPHPKELRDQAAFEYVLSVLRKRHSEGN